MKRMFAAMLLALLGLPAIESSASAQDQGPFGCGGFCFKFLGGLHQHGPLFNYGPYAGYYPFAPYGPWTSDLQYTGPGLNGATCGPLGCGHGRGCGAAGCGAGSSAGCSTCGGSGIASGFGLGQRFHGGRSERDASACDSCATAPADSPLGFFKKVFSRCHPGSEKATVSTGCSAAPACPATTACTGGTAVELAKPCGGCSASVRTAPVLQAVSASGQFESPSDARYRRER